MVIGVHSGLGFPTLRSGANGAGVGRKVCLGYLESIIEQSYTVGQGAWDGDVGVDDIRGVIW